MRGTIGRSLLSSSDKFRVAVWAKHIRALQWARLDAVVQQAGTRQ